VDSLTFIAAITKALAWPATIIVVVILLRHQLRSLVGDLRRLKYKDFEADFGKSLELATVEADKAGLPPLPPKSEALGATLITGPRFERLAQASPRAAILDTWLDLEAAVRELASKHNVPASEQVSVRALAQQLHIQEVLSQSDLKLFDTLRHLRNAAAHSLAEITVDQAREFRTLALRLIDELNRK
jgi:hypothetical protein